MRLRISPASVTISFSCDQSITIIINIKHDDNHYYYHYRHCIKILDGKRRRVNDGNISIRCKIAWWRLWIIVFHHNQPTSRTTIVLINALQLTLLLLNENHLRERIFRYFIDVLFLDRFSLTILWVIGVMRRATQTRLYMGQKRMKTVFLNRNWKFRWLLSSW